MKVNVENIKVLKVEHNGEIIVFKSDDIVSLEYKSVSARVSTAGLIQILKEELHKLQILLLQLTVVLCIIHKYMKLLLRI